MPSATARSAWASLTPSSAFSSSKRDRASRWSANSTSGLVASPAARLFFDRAPVSDCEAHDRLRGGDVGPLGIEQVEALFDREHHFLDFAVEVKIGRHQLFACRPGGRVAAAEIGGIVVHREEIAAAPVLERAPMLRDLIDDPLVSVLAIDTHGGVKSRAADSPSSGRRARRLPRLTRIGVAAQGQIDQGRKIVFRLCPVSRQIVVEAAGRGFEPGFEFDRLLAGAGLPFMLHHRRRPSRRI